MTDNHAQPSAEEQDLQDEQLEDVMGGYRGGIMVNPIDEEAASLQIKAKAKS